MPSRMFPNAAEANRSIFYDRSGNARSVSQVYAVLNARYAGAAHSSDTRTAMAAVGGDIQNPVALASAVPAPALSSDNAAYLVELSGFARRDAGRGELARTHADRVDQSDLPLAIPGRRPDPADLAGGAGIVGPFVFAATVASLSGQNC